jgi:hypothetical protein
MSLVKELEPVLWREVSRAKMWEFEESELVSRNSGEIELVESARRGPSTWPTWWRGSCSSRSVCCCDVER